METKIMIKKYRDLMKNIDVDPRVEQQIVENCAKYATFKKIKSKKYTITAVLDKAKDGSV